MIHADIAGPFIRTSHGYQYALILVDDHTRFKSIHFMRHKSEAHAHIRCFISAFTAHANKRAARPTLIVGTLHSDNAGEFTSRQFTEFLADHCIHSSTCPPHIHQLNRVAEPAIRSDMELARASIVASNAPVSFWDHATLQAVDILNRTTGPPNTNATAYEMLTGDKPRVMSIMPFGCRAFAVKPRPAYSKTRMEPRAWVGMNLGRSRLSPGAYDIWIPSAGKVVTTSDVYFDELSYPWRPTNQIAASLAQRSDGDADQPPGLPASTCDPPSLVSDPALSNASALMPPSREARPRRALLLFSGPIARRDGVAAFLSRFSYPSDSVDNGPAHGGGGEDDLLNDAVYERLLQRCAGGYCSVILASPPCSTFSVSRLFVSLSARDGGPPPVRDRENVMGLPDVPERHTRDEVAEANELIRRSTRLLRAARDSGAEY
eukprot:1162397-Pleurochrysis_carterae.AAC.1